MGESSTTRHWYSVGGGELKDGAQPTGKRPRESRRSNAPGPSGCGSVLLTFFKTS